jgi:hypothetical protein
LPMEIAESLAPDHPWEGPVATGPYGCEHNIGSVSCRGDATRNPHGRILRFPGASVAVRLELCSPFSP